MHQVQSWQRITVMKLIRYNLYGNSGIIVRPRLFFFHSWFVSVPFRCKKYFLAHWKAFFNAIGKFSEDEPVPLIKHGVRRTLTAVSSHIRSSIFSQTFLEVILKILAVCIFPVLICNDNKARSTISVSILWCSYHKMKVFKK